MLARLRALRRLARVGLHLAHGMGVAACVYPFIGRPLRLALKQRWSHRLLAILGLRLRAGGPLRPGALIVANHISWLDIFVINALAPAAFVSKAEVRAWPAIGWLCGRTETVFLERGKRNAARSAATAVAQRLRRGEWVSVFPEGTTSEGADVLRFHSALLQAAIDADSPVQPLALRYLDGAEKRSAAAAYCGATSLWQSLWAIASEPALTAHVDVLPTLAPRAMKRGELAQTTHAQIRAALAQRACTPEQTVILNAGSLQAGLQTGAGA